MQTIKWITRWFVFFSGWLVLLAGTYGFSFFIISWLDSWWRWLFPYEYVIVGAEG